MTAEEAIACGTKEILILGTAGTMSDSLEISDVILCDRAVRDEGVSHHYLKSSKYVKPDKSLTKKLGAAMTRAGIKFVFGTTWTIDAPYMETKEEIRHYKEEGVAAVEMEAAALFAVTKKRNAKSARCLPFQTYWEQSGAAL